MEDMPEHIASGTQCAVHTEAIIKNTSAVNVLAETVRYGFKSGEERMDRLSEKIDENHKELKDKLESHGKRLDTLESDVCLTRKVKIAFYWIGGFSGLAAAILWIAGPLKSLARAIVNP
jgi:hypothetical protein